ncbi:hypothetical protein [Protaetiibacter larvae]|uniref:Uncharacterized protein n=1 Tax=Protaetiibacter larvae TaxID=2592654 RepID=A0A5C1Y6K7_9MICO|nr:hypothetical protein [Protaetiibacter larvae]QEO08592.1 hypothetical protein FLP23_00235 [Protaetiibacter larvae]
MAITNSNPPASQPEARCPGNRGQVSQPSAPQSVRLALVGILVPVPLDIVRGGFAIQEAIALDALAEIPVIVASVVLLLGIYAVAMILVLLGYRVAPFVVSLCGVWAVVAAWSSGSLPALVISTLALVLVVFIWAAGARAFGSARRAQRLAKRPR